MPGMFTVSLLALHCERQDQRGQSTLLGGVSGVKKMNSLSWVLQKA